MAYGGVPVVKDREYSRTTKVARHHHRLARASTRAASEKEARFEKLTPVVLDDRGKGLEKHSTCTRTCSRSLSRRCRSRRHCRSARRRRDPYEIRIDEESELMWHSLLRNHVKRHETEENRELNDLLDALE